jgi:hypothetical protein
MEVPDQIEESKNEAVARPNEWESNLNLENLGRPVRNL